MVGQYAAMFFFFYEQCNSHIKQLSQVDLFMVFVCLKEINMAITSTWMSEVTFPVGPFDFTGHKKYKCNISKKKTLDF